MNAMFEFLILAFATIGFGSLFLWILRSGWGTPWKVIGALLIVSLWWAMCNGPLGGKWGADHGALTDLIATFGIVIATTWGFRRVGNDRRFQTVMVVGAGVFLLLMWVPRWNSRWLNILNATNSTPTTPSHPSIHSIPNHPTSDRVIDCDALSYGRRKALGCP